MEPTQDTKPTYLVNLPAYGMSEADVLTVERFTVRYKAKRRQKGTLGGVFAVVEQCGEDRSELDVTVKGLRSDGRTSQHHSVRCANTAAGLKGVVRRLRDDDAERIAEHDERIAELQAQIADERRKRSLTVRKAWTHGAVVRLGEVEVKRWMPA